MAAFAVVTPNGCRVAVPSEWFVHTSTTADIESDCEFLCFDDFD